MPVCPQERGALFEATLRAVKQVHDPTGIMNPDVLIRTSANPEPLTSYLAEGAAEAVLVPKAGSRGSRL